MRNGNIEEFFPESGFEPMSMETGNEAWMVMVIMGDEQTVAKLMACSGVA